MGFFKQEPMPSIQGEIDKLNAEEKRERQIEANAAIMRGITKAYDSLPPDGKKKVLDALRADSDKHADQDLGLK